MEKWPVFILFSIRIAPSTPIPLSLEKIASMNIVLSSIILVKKLSTSNFGKIYAGRPTIYFNLKILHKEKNSFPTWYLIFICVFNSSTFQ